jgi:hypothetical protein
MRIFPGKRTNMSIEKAEKVEKVRSWARED